MQNRLEIQIQKHARNKLYGKKAKVGDFMEEIVRLRTQGDLHRVISLTHEDIAQRLGISRQQTIRYRNMAVKMGKLQVDENGKEITSGRIKKIKEFEILRKDDFVKKPLIRQWVSDLLTRKQGKPLKTWKINVTSLRRLCNYCKINPEQLIIDRQTTEMIMKNFAESCSTNTSPNDEFNIVIRETTVHNYVMVVRRFCAFYGVTWPKGVTGKHAARNHKNDFIVTDPTGFEPATYCSASNRTIQAMQRVQMILEIYA